ncbi:DUF4123 domain-containing protein [Chromohalobacter nigrandesensis]|uniref:DUF4123 domain-containing protein n=1 Tax=Chromohalobacter nigrandesensis TaxID=119863 RepID=UPI001FF4DC68|nr:DUF4123 domain-containing protein [Chromohalobacter nigrandesensis]MCK0746808.1 DUF4123 domain-containing protein [Chromohalobacter nigrandesensis]
MTSWLLHDHLNGPLELDGVEFMGALRPRRRSDLHALTPHLYRVNESAISHVRERAEAMSRHGMPPALCALLRADIEPTVLQEQLSRFCLAATPTARWMYCRFFDPRVMTHLRWILMPEQLQSLLGNIQRWELLDAGRHWVSIPNQAPTTGRILRLTLDADQLRYLEALPTIRECLQQWRDQAPHAVVDESAAGRHIAERLTHARQRGLQDERDRLALVLHELLVHPDILQHPDVAHAVALAQGGTAYRTVTGNWPQARWETIQTQLTTRETT